MQSRFGSRAHTHNHYSCGEYNLDKISILPENQKFVCLSCGLSILLNILALFPWHHISHFHICFFFHSPFATGKLHSNSLSLPSLGQFHYCFMSQSPWLHLITALLLDQLCWCWDTSIRLKPNACRHLFFLPPKEWETM